MTWQQVLGHLEAETAAIWLREPEDVRALRLGVIGSDAGVYGQYFSPWIMVTGLIPLLTATGAGAASRFSIGLVVVAGMSIGTLFTLFVLPAVYVVLATDHRAAADSERNKQVNDLDLNSKALRPT